MKGLLFSSARPSLPLVRGLQASITSQSYSSLSPKWSRSSRQTTFLNVLLLHQTVLTPRPGPMWRPSPALPVTHSPPILSRPYTSPSVAPGAIPANSSLSHPVPSDLFCQDTVQPLCRATHMMFPPDPLGVLASIFCFSHRSPGLYTQQAHLLS